MKKTLRNAIENSKEDRSLILRRGRQTIRRATARLPKVFKIPEPARDCQRRVNKGTNIGGGSEKAEWTAQSVLLLLRHFPRYLFHKLGAKIGQHALHNAGDVRWLAFRRGCGLLQNLLGALRSRPSSGL